MNFEQQQVLQRLVSIQGQQIEADSEAPVEDLHSLYQEAQQLISELASHPDDVSIEDLEGFWAESMTALGPEWEDMLCEVLDIADEAETAGQPFNRNGHMYWRVLDRCYLTLQEEDVELCRELFHGCLSCLRAARTLQESEIREQAEKQSLRNFT